MHWLGCTWRRRGEEEEEERGREGGGAGCTILVHGGLVQQVGIYLGIDV